MKNILYALMFSIFALSCVTEKGNTPVVQEQESEEAEAREKRENRERFHQTYPYMDFRHDRDMGDENAAE